MLVSGCHDQMLYTSSDFKHWHFEGSFFDRGSECPDFFKLPDVVNTNASNISQQYVLKTEQFYIGSYDQKAQKFVPAGRPFAVQDGADGYSYDTYAGKSFMDESSGLRRWFEWVQELTPACSDSESDGNEIQQPHPCKNMTTWPILRTWGSMLSLCYVLSFDPSFPGKLIQRPPPELSLLRVRQDANRRGVLVRLGADPIRLELPPGAGNQMEIIVRWVWPTVPGVYELGLRLLEGDGLTGRPREVTVISATVTIGQLEGEEKENGVLCVVDRRASSSLATFAGGYPFFHDTAFLRTNATVPRGKVVNSGDDTLLMHVVVDHSIIEAFFLDGRSRMTSRVYPLPTSLGLSLFANELTTPSGQQRRLSAEVQSVEVWALDAAWAQTEDVLKTWENKTAAARAVRTQR